MAVQTLTSFLERHVVQQKPKVAGAALYHNITAKIQANVGNYF